MTPDELDWFDEAICSGVALERGDHYLFFGTGVAATHRAALNAGKALCAICPVNLRCIQYAEEFEIEYGTYGGLDQEERRQFLNRFDSVNTSRGRAEYERILNRLRASRETVPKGN